MNVIAKLAALMLSAGLLAQGGTIRIGAKSFTESAVLCELMAQTIEAHTDLTVERRTGLGGTMICWTALTSGEIDIYAEYTGTAWATILGRTDKVTDPLRTYFLVQSRCLDQFDVHWLQPFGFDNTYALAMREQAATDLGIERISDLQRYQHQLRVGFSVEFASRSDGYPGLAAAYGLSFDNLRTLEHTLIYQAVDAGSIDLMAAYSTDGKLLRYDLRILEDDRHFFPPYHAAPMVRGATVREHPEVGRALSRLAFALTDRDAQALNYVVETKASPALVARAFLEIRGIVDGVDAAAGQAREALQRVLAKSPAPGSEAVDRPGFWALLLVKGTQLLKWLLQHLGLTSSAVLLAILVAVPLGIVTTERPRLQKLLLGAAGVVQTIPSLALLALMIPILGLDLKAAIAALFLYAVLPILRNTCAGIAGVPPDLVDAARGMGLRPGEVLRRVQLPLAMRTIMAGIRTSTVISIGVATLAAFVGAGGFGQPIFDGLYLNDTGLILLGAVPAALLAVLADLGLGRVEQLLQPGRRRTRTTG